MQRPTRGRLGRWLLAAALCLAAGPGLGEVAGLERRSIDLGSGLGNGLEQRQSQHPHAAADKPSKLDLDLGQYTETDDRDLHELERARLAAAAAAAGATAGSTKQQSESEAGERRLQQMNLEPSNVTTSVQEKTADQQTLRFKCENGTVSVKCIEKKIGNFLRTVSTFDTLNVTDSVQIVKKTDKELNELKKLDNTKNNTSLVERIHRYARDHVLKINLSNTFLAPRGSRTFFGSFGLKKLLLPLFIGAQIIKSILIALFLPSIIGSIGKIVGKGVTSFAQSSQMSPQQLEENYEFKDNTDMYSEDYMTRQPLGTLPASTMYEEAGGGSAQTKAPEIASRYAFVDPRLTPMMGGGGGGGGGPLSDRYYTRHVVNPQAKRQDFKVFHEIPTSSLLLTNYDPFYSPLLSRLDAVFSRLGHGSEACREYAVCAMYRSPARYAPYSNLVSAQLSRELNELRKPSSDNPDVLRFFRYMRAAKDGQDGLRCEDAYAECEGARDDQTLRQNQAMLATYQDIDKLVHARMI